MGRQKEEKKYITAPAFSAGNTSKDASSSSSSPVILFPSVFKLFLCCCFIIRPSYTSFEIIFLKRVKDGASFPWTSFSFLLFLVFTVCAKHLLSCARQTSRGANLGESVLVGAVTPLHSSFKIFLAVYGFASFSEHV